MWGHPPEARCARLPPRGEETKTAIRGSPFSLLRLIDQLQAIVAVRVCCVGLPLSTMITVVTPEPSASQLTSDELPHTATTGGVAMPTEGVTLTL